MERGEVLVVKRSVVIVEDARDVVPEVVGKTSAQPNNSICAIGTASFKTRLNVNRIRITPRNGCTKKMVFFDNDEETIR